MLFWAAQCIEMQLGGYSLQPWATETTIMAVVADCQGKADSPDGWPIVQAQRF